MKETNQNINTNNKIYCEKVISKCAHDKYKIKDISDCDADGIDQSFCFHVICIKCESVLLKRYENISATWEDVYDNEWIKKNMHLLSS